MPRMKSKLAQERLLAGLARERGIDDDFEHHVVLYVLRLLDDDDNYQLFCEMVREDEECEQGTPLAGWAELRGSIEPTEVLKEET